MLFKDKTIWIFGLLLLVMVATGCVHNVPLAVDATKDMSRALPRTKKIPVKVGMYLSDDLKKYVYRQHKMGMTFQMNVGEYLPPISLQMASAMFEDVASVNALPPYNGGYKPDVEAVVVPEILYCYGNAVGTVSGYIEGKAKIRITAYDLGGKVLWQDEALGESRSKEMSFVGAFLGGMEEVGKTGYQAAFAAAVKIINDFNARPPKELYSLLDIKHMTSMKNRRNISELYKNFYEKGQFQYEKKNYYQALYSFEKAAGLNTDDPAALFYIGACYTFTGDKDKAIDAYKKVVEKSPRSLEAGDSKKWLEILKEPLKIAVVGSNNDSESIRRALTDSGMYEVIDVNDLRPPATANLQKDWNSFLERCTKKGIKIVVVSDIDSPSQKIRIDQQPSGDVATEHVVKISSKAYSTKKKEVKTEIKIIERTSTMTEQTQEATNTIKGQLLKNGAKKLVLRLLENNIY